MFLMLTLGNGTMTEMSFRLTGDLQICRLSILEGSDRFVSVGKGKGTETRERELVLLLPVERI